MNLPPKSEKGEPLLILEPSDVESFAFLNPVQKYPANEPIEQILDTHDGTNFQAITDQQMGQSFKDFVVVGPDENVDISRLYFLVSSDEQHPIVTGENIPSANSFVLSQDRNINIKDEPLISLINEKPNKEQNDIEKSDSLQRDVLTSQTLQHPIPISFSSDSNVNESKGRFVAEDENALNIEERLLKRDALLPQKSSRKACKRSITCDMCKSEFNSPSQYYSHRNIHMQKGNGKKASWCCTQCGKEFNDCKKLKCHELKEHGEVRMYPCPHCVHSFPKLLLLEYHIRNVHRGEKRFYCKLCGYKFFRFYDLKIHLNIHFNIKSHVCHFCGQQFSHSSNLLRHLRLHTNVKPYSCNYCGRRFSHKNSMLAHLVSHTSGGSCSECSSKFHSIAGLRNHMKNVHKKNICNKKLLSYFFESSWDQISRLYNCVVCAERFRFKKGLEIHEKIAHSNKSLPCKSCHKVYPYISYFKRHPCIKKESNSELKGNPYKCVVCQKSFKTFEDSEIHVCNVELEMDKLKPAESNEIEGISIIKDESCDETLVMYINVNEDDSSTPTVQDLTNNESQESQTFESLTSLFSKTWTDEIAEEKEDTISSSPLPKKGTTKPESKKEQPKETKSSSIFGTKRISKPRKKASQNAKVPRDKAPSDKIFKCTQCWKTFTKTWNWRQHLGTHDASLRRYVCAECGKSFSYRSTYTTHLKSHSKKTIIKKFSCSQCPKVYNSKNVLDQHIKRVHNKQCNYMCTLCSKGFFNKCDYSYHMRIHRKEFPFVCFACGKGFAHLSHIHRHERIHTGERPHKCPYCPKAFIQPVTLRIHLKKHDDARGLPREEEEVDPPAYVTTNDVIRNIEGEREMAVIKLEEMNNMFTTSHVSLRGSSERNAVFDRYS